MRSGRLRTCLRSSLTATSTCGRRSDRAPGRTSNHHRRVESPPKPGWVERRRRHHRRTGTGRKCRRSNAVACGGELVEVFSGETVGGCEGLRRVGGGLPLDEGGREQTAGRLVRERGNHVENPG